LAIHFNDDMLLTRQHRMKGREMTTAIDQQIEAAKQRLEQLKAKKQKVEAQKRALEQKRSRKDDTRRKILLGAMILEQMEKDEVKRASILADLDVHLVRTDDRTLFGFEKTTTLLDLVQAARPHLFGRKEAA